MAIKKENKKNSLSNIRGFSGEFVIFKSMSEQTESSKEENYWFIHV